MADGIAITAGSGTTILTDDTGAGGHAQVVKLAIATDGSGTLIPADGTDGLLVNLGANNDVVVSATNLDIRDLSSASDSVTVAQATASNLKAEVSNAGTFAVQATLGAETTKVIGTVNVAAGQSIAVTQGTAGSLNCTEASAAAIKTAVEVIDNPVVVDDAGFTPATTSVMMAGFTADDTSTDVVNEGDGGAARMTTDRKQIVVLGESGANQVRGGGSKTDTTAQALMAASGDAAISNYLAWVTVYNSSATNTAVEIRDGTTTVVAIIPAPAYGGAIFQPPHPIKMTANTATNAYAQTGVTTLYVYGGGYKGV